MAPKKVPPASVIAAAGQRIAFDPETQEIILDLKGLCALPYDLELSAFHSFRGIIMPSGKFVHEPKKAGKYLVLGNFRSVTCFTLVHFKPSMERTSELLLSFVDHGLANATSMHGVQVETVMLPLLVSAGVYSKALRMTSVQDIVAFETINTKSLPYSKDLAPFLKTHSLYKSLNISTQPELLSYIMKPLGGRLPHIEAAAKEALAGSVAALAPQGQQYADDARAGLEPRLASLIQQMRNLPPEHYDAPLTSRIKTIEMVDPPDHQAAEQGVPEWLDTPLKAALDQGTAKADYTTFKAANSPIRMPTRSSPGRVGLVDDEDGDDDDDDDDSDEDGDDDDEDSDSKEEHSGSDKAAGSSLIQSEKRARVSTDHYVPTRPGKGKGTGAPKPKAAAEPRQAKGSKAKQHKVDKSCAPGVDPLAPFGRKKNGKPYARSCGAYNAALIPKPTNPTSNVRDKTVHDLREANKSLTKQLQDALAEVASLKATESSAVKLARAEELSAKHEAYHQAYMSGLNKGLEIASGGRVMATPQSGAGASGTSA